MGERPHVIRRQFLVDKSIQIPLLAYSMAMATVGLGLASLFTVIWVTSDLSIITPFNQILFFFVGSIIAIVAMLFLGVILTNRVAGPLMRIKKHMAAVNNGENPPPLTTRKGDFLSEDFVDLYNELTTKVNEKS